MLSFLRTYGPLDDAGKYAGSRIAPDTPAARRRHQTGVLSQPIDMHTLLDDDFWDGILFEEQFEMQATMFQPVGGMDRIPYAFAKALGDTVQFDSPVTEIRKTAKGVRIGYTRNGAAKSIEADYCFCGMPLTILKKTPNDFSAPYKKVIDECTYAGAYKIAWESRRFWEQDYNIYGGLEFLATGCSPVWFPSAGSLANGASWSAATRIRLHAQGLTLEQKFAASRNSIERLHPGHGKELEKPIYVGWSHIPHNEGSWIRAYGPGQERWQPYGLTRQTGKHNIRPRRASRSIRATRPSSNPMGQSSSRATT